jgi:hypothetical protein
MEAGEDSKVGIVLRAYIRIALRESKLQTDTLEPWPLTGFVGHERRRELILNSLREAIKQVKATLKETR